MDTIPEPFSLCNAPSSLRGGRAGFRVPFGLRDGRAWAPAEVAKGKACGCVCPGCGAPLAAKAQTSRRRRAHFAHLTHVDCQTGRETGIHLRAKQVIAEYRELLLPAWVGDLIDKPNPPRARDEYGQLHQGAVVEYPARRAALQQIELERPFGPFQPDVYALDEVGELLIEIRVAHAVDDTKAAKVQCSGRRMIEIDLSCLDRSVPHDPAAFEHAVLADPVNRAWISCPEADQAWLASKNELDRKIENLNAQRAREREHAIKAAETCARREQIASKGKTARREHVRKLERMKHAADLAQLTDLVSPNRIRGVLREYQVFAEPRTSEMLNAASPAVRSICLRAHADAWIFGVDPALWQLLAHEHFVGKRPPGSRFNQKDVADWVRRSFPYERPLYRLFATQYGKRADARRAGYRKRRLDYWVFTEEENALIPNFYSPVNDFVDRLVAAMLVRRLPVPIGECTVLPPPTSGFRPIAAVAADSTRVELSQRIDPS